MALPTSNLSVNLILSTLGVTTAKDIFYTGGVLNTIAEIGAIVSKTGLNATYCPGADADARLANLLADRKLSYFKGYEPIIPTKLGYIYGGFTILNSNFAPTGWHVPTESECDTLISQLGGTSVAGGKMKSISTEFWISPNVGADNSSGLSFNGSGERSVTGEFRDIAVGAFIPTSTETSANNYAYFALNSSNAIAFTSDSGFNIFRGWGVRLIKDDSTDPNGFTDQDGNEYDTVKIGSQVWMVGNYKCTKMGNGTSIPNITDNSTWQSTVSTGLARCAYDNDENNV